MSRQAKERLDWLIEKYRLHDSVPVSIDQLLEPLQVSYHPFSPRTLGFALILPHVAEIGLNEALPLPWQRMAAAHEYCHTLIKSPNSFYLCEINRWFYEKLERQVQRLAAQLLVPSYALAEGLTIQEIAARLEVPESLVEIRAQL